ncbi:hypothetical protein [Bacillus xiapuensis]|uniref:Uncharacterized protein n=1 Tax=Bacillus xiapuensis TaxID=2014075 RepID=A0ABU6N6I3_9BACI|nr:hypothetical protein [Bacillus xiapuensis]
MLDELLNSSLEQMKVELDSLKEVLQTKEIKNVYVKKAIFHRMDELITEIDYLKTKVH